MEEYDPTMSSLLSMAETFLGQTPPEVPQATRCLLAVLSQHPPPRIEARTRLQLGLTLFHHTNNLLEAREHLDKAALVAQSAANLEEVRFEATSVSAHILVEQQNFHTAKSLLRGRIESSTHHPYWHIRLLLQLADVCMSERDEGGVVSALDKCAEFARQVDAPYTRLLCSLYKGAFLLTHHRYQEAGEVLNHTSGLMEDYHGDKEILIRTFYLIVQVSHLLVAGQVKAAKPHLKQLQQRVKALSSNQSLAQFGAPASMDARLLPENFQWLTREQTFVMVYLVSVMHSVQGGYTDKALSYAEKAMHFMPLDASKDCSVLSVLRAHLLEHTIQCLLMKGDTASAADKIHEVLEVCHGHSQLVYAHRAVLHTLLGLYAFATDNLERTAVQFHAALQHTNSGELRVFVSLNLALTYMKLGDSRSTELNALMKSIESDSATESCQSLRAALHYVRGLYSFTQLKLHEAKRHLRETLLLSNKSDLNRLTTCSLILLGQIFLSIGNTKETMDMVDPAVKLSKKIPDKKLQVWAASLLADLYHLTGDQENEFSLRQQSAATAEEIQSDLSLAVQSRYHNLIQWTVGEWPIDQQPGDKQVRHPIAIAKSSSQPGPKSKRRKVQERSFDATSGTNPSVLREEQHGGKEQDRRGDSPKLNNPGFQSPGSQELINSSPTSRRSPKVIKTPELKLKKVTTPTSTNSPLNFSTHLSSKEDSRTLHQESNGNEPRHLIPANTQNSSEHHYLPSTPHSQPNLPSDHQDDVPRFSSLPSAYSSPYHPNPDHHQQHYSSHLTSQHALMPDQQVRSSHLFQQPTAQVNTGDDGNSLLQQPPHQPATGNSPLNPPLLQQLSPPAMRTGNVSNSAPSNPTPSTQSFMQQPNHHGVRLKSLQRPSDRSATLSASQPQHSHLQPQSEQRPLSSSQPQYPQRYSQLDRSATSQAQYSKSQSSQLLPLLDQRHSLPASQPQHSHLPPLLDQRHSLPASQPQHLHLPPLLDQRHSLPSSQPQHSHLPPLLEQMSASQPHHLRLPPPLEQSRPASQPQHSHLSPPLEQRPSLHTSQSQHSHLQQGGGGLALAPQGRSSGVNTSQPQHLLSNSSPTPPLYLGSPLAGHTGLAMQYPQRYMVQQKQLEEEHKLLSSQQQMEHQQLLDHQQVNKVMAPHPLQNSSPQKYFPAPGAVDQSLLQQQFQQQQLIRQQAQMQQQYLLQQAGNRSVHSNLPGYVQAGYHGMSPAIHTKSSPPQMSPLSHMMSHQRAALEQQNKPAMGVGGQLPSQMPTVAPSSQYPGVGFGQLLPNGGNNMPPNPYSPLRHFKPF